MKKLSFIQNNPERHWVGDGFPVRSVFSYHDRPREFSPFLLLDYAGPARFTPTEQRRGVGGHPHRGFETVTIVYDGEVEHRDSAGGGGKIGPGDVQWMTAASGLVHEEFHGTEYARQGGPFEMIQLWVNLPRKDKLGKPGYQGITGAQIPRAELPDGAGCLRVIAGKYGDAQGPAHTFSPMNVWDLSVPAGKRVTLTVPADWTCALFVRRGSIRLASGEIAGEADLAVLERAGTELQFEATAATEVMLLNGEPIDEPVVGYGPFVMTSEDEIRQAIIDFKSGKMGGL